MSPLFAVRKVSGLFIIAILLGNPSWSFGAEKGRPSLPPLPPGFHTDNALLKDLYGEGITNGFNSMGHFKKEVLPKASRFQFPQSNASGEGRRFGPSEAKQYDALWLKQFGNADNPSRDIPRAVVADRDGYSYVMGSSKEALLVMKLNPDGSTNWTRTYDPGFHGYQYPEAIGLDSAGNVYVAGETRQYYNSWSKVIVVKYDAQGNQQWASIEEGTGYNFSYVMSMAVSPSGEVCVAGGRIGSSGWEAEIKKFAVDGTKEWEYTHDDINSQYESFNAIIFGNSGRVLATGYMRLETGAVAGLTVCLAGWGDSLWVRTRNDMPSVAMYGEAICSDPAGNVYVAMDILDRTLGKSRMDVVAYYYTGAEKIMDHASPFLEGDLEQSIVTSIAVDAQHNVVLGGRQFFTTTNPAGSCVLCVVKYDANGMVSWARLDSLSHAEGRYMFYGYGIAFEADGGITLAGGGYASQAGIVLRYTGTGVLRSRTVLPTTNVDYQYGYVQGGERALVYRCGEIRVDQPPLVDYNVSTSVIDGSGSERWASTFDGEPSTLWHGGASAVDRDGNSYYAYSGAGKMTLLKFLPSGAQSWSVEYSGLVPRKMCISSNGNIVVQADNTTDGGFDMMGYGTSGNLLFVTPILGDRFHRITGILPDHSGHVYLFGSMFDAAKPDVDRGLKVAQFASNGVQIWTWAQTISGGADKETITDAVVDANDDIYIAGWRGNQFLAEGEIARIVNVGATEWRKTVTSPDLSPVGPIGHIALDNSGNVVVSNEYGGSSKSVQVYGSDGGFKSRITNIPGSENSAIQLLTTDANGNIIVVTDAVSKIDPVGTVLWTKNLDFTPTGIKLNGTGKIFAAGTKGTDLYPFKNIRLMEYGTDGTELWNLENSSMYTSDPSVGLAVDDFGGVYLAGTEQSAFLQKFQLQDAELLTNVSYSTTNLNFGSVAIGCDQTISFELTNEQDQGVRVDSVIAVDPGAAGFVPQAGPVAVLPHSTTTISVRFRPYAMGLKAAKVLVYRHAVPVPDTVSVSGTGIGTGEELVLSVDHAGEGWRLASIPVQSACPVVMNEQWFSFESGYKLSSTPAPKSGYWVKYGSTAPVTFVGQPLTPQTIPLHDKWNLIGALSQPVSVSDITSDPPGILATAIFAYDPDGGYVSAGTLQAGHGYWVKASLAGNLIVGGAGSALGKTAINNMKAAVPGYELLFTDAKGATRTLYINPAKMNTADLSRFELPPLPPDGVFDVRYRTGRNVAAIDELSSKGVEVGLAGASFPVTVEWKDPIRGMMLNSASGIVNMERPGVLRLENAAAPVRIISDGTVNGKPMEFALLPNYPNPFNPVTTIKFALAEPGQSQLEVYNVLGQVVARLVDGYITAGYHQVQWDASANPSGVYYYTLRSGTHTETRKMLLMR